ncbi:DUF4013 domain-containing protein [Methanobrevibacter sp.]|uniref:DUF4013 domain-containing protein n=1 Tax=Methanobrevibacter sp. TaxID=66852 RepID=UPI0025ED3956|nr:DUF4013 domain-containing protein [Methanobrevibacter sp.]MBR4447166.1 DUF4013 domain-containing protein [Methanobrevibacter sp.]
MASITDCVVEGLKYPFNDIKKLLGCGVLFALMSVLSLGFSLKSFGIFKASVDVMEKTNSHFSALQFSQLPTGDIYITIAIAIISFIVALFIMGYQYDIVKFSIDKKQELPGFDDILGMFIKGVKYFIVTLAYNIIPILVLAAGIALLQDSSAILVIVFIAMILFIIAFFLLIMALNNMIAHDDIRKAFDFREIIGNIANLGRGKYIGIVIFTLIVYMIIMAATSFILSLLSMAFVAAISNQAVWVSAFIAIIEGLFIDSYGALFYNRVCGSIYRESIK